MVISCTGYGQDSIFKKLPDKYLTHVNTSTNKYQARINKCSDKALASMIKQEKRIQRKLQRIDPVAANRLFTDSLTKIRNRMRSKVLSATPASGFLDTTHLSLQFLEKFGNQPQLGNTLNSVQELQGKLQQTEQLKSYIDSRRKELQDQLSQYTSFTKELNKINKEAYYYRQHLSEYKSTFEDHQKIQARAIELLKKLPAYNDFIARNSQLAGLFNLSSNYNETRSLEGLQVRSQVEQLLQQRIGTDPNARSMATDQVNQARDRFNEFKSKFPQLDNTDQMPDFKPNEMKTKSIWSRLEPGGNLQFQKANYYFPTLTDIAGQIAYRFTTKGSAGLGASYRIGMGEGWNKIHITHQGMGLRSFVDWKLKGSFYINGGYELTKTSNINNNDNLRNWNGWMSSALIGINRKQKVGPKLFLNTMILYDFLASNQPKTDKIKIRIGYTLQ